VLGDPRHPDHIEHSFTTRIRMRIFGILAQTGPLVNNPR
jgi:hypothetical protein